MLFKRPSIKLVGKTTLRPATAARHSFAELWQTMHSDIFHVRQKSVKSTLKVGEVANGVGSICALQVVSSLAGGSWQKQKETQKSEEC